MNTIDAQELIKSYNSGQTILRLAKKNKTSEVRVKRILMENQIPLRSQKDACSLRKYSKDFGKNKIKFQDEITIAQICELYKNNTTISQIAKLLNTSQVSITTILKTHSLQYQNRKSLKNSRGKVFSRLQPFISDIITAYKAGESIQTLSQKYNVQPYRIKIILTTNNIHVYSQTEASLLQLASQINFNTITTLYNKGESILTLSKKYKRSENTIKKILQSTNTPIRNQTAARNTDKYKKNFSNSRIKIKDPQIIQEIIDLYNSGMNSFDICSKYDVSPGAIRLLLQRNGIPIRGQSAAQQQSFLQNKKKQLYFNQHGVYHAMQRSDIFEKSLKSAFKYKSANINGKEFKNLQGYEEFGIKYIINTFFGVTVNDIEAGERKNIPSIWYADINNIKRIHHPDMFIPKLNTLIEIKSKYTFEANKKQNLLKRQSAISQGYNYIILIFDDIGNCINEI